MENFDLWPQLVALGQVIVIDLVLAGDNAIVVGMAAAGGAGAAQQGDLLGHCRRGGAAHRLCAVTVQLLAIIGLTLAGGILLLWVCWKMYREMRIQAGLGRRQAAMDAAEAARVADASASAARSHRSSSPTCRCRSTTCWRWPAPPRAMFGC